MDIAASIARALAVLGLVAAGTLAILSGTLPKPSKGDRFGADVLVALEHGSARGSVGSLAGRPVRISCRGLSWRTSLVDAGDGARFAVEATHVVRLDDAGGRRLSAYHPTRSGEELAALADLSGSFKLYSRELAARLFRGERIVVGPGSFRGARGIWVEIGKARPHVRLLVARKTLRPLAARYVSRRLSGTARIIPGKRGPASC